MRLKIILGRLAIAIACMGVFAVQAASTWDESTNDDLSNDGLPPTQLTMTIGLKNVIGIKTLWRYYPRLHDSRATR